MKNKLLTKIKFDKPKKAEFGIKDNKLIISGISFTDYHDQDCCENVYADFESIVDYKKQVEDLKKIDKIEVKNVKDMGFIIFVYNKKQRIGILVNCYNEQNGYYSDELKLIIKNHQGFVKKFEIDKIDKID